MRAQKVCLIINPRDGQNLAKLTAILAVFSAAGWRTDVLLKEYGGHTMELAAEAAMQGYDRVIAYGGDGTLNQVVNGLMSGKKGKKQKSIVGILPGGTANVWAGEVSFPADPVQAALTLVSSENRKVDVGHLDISTLTFLSATQEDAEHPPVQDVPGKIAQVRKIKTSVKGKHHFLLMAGLGLDAAIMGQVDKTLKHRVGAISVGIAAAQKVPEQHAFPIEVNVTENEGGTEKTWRGEALQVIIGNTRRYARVLEMTADASIDDGMLDVCVIMAGEPLSTMQQISSLLLRRKPDNQNTQFFRGSHISMRVPASIGLQLDGSAVKLKDYLSKSDREALQQAGDQEHVLVAYQFDAMPRVLEVAIPAAYDGALFEQSHPQEMPQSSESEQQAKTETVEQQPDATTPGEQQSQELPSALLEHGRKVAVIAAASQSEKKCVFIIAGTTSKSSTGETIPVAIRIDGQTELLKRTGTPAAISDVQQLQEGAEIVVEGKKSKREVIHAKRAVL